MSSGDKSIACVFCASRGPFSQRPYDFRTLPTGVNWPSRHCFEGKTIALCPECGGGFVREGMLDQEISAFYASIYDSRFVAAAPKVHDLNELNPRFLSQVLYLKSWINLFDGMRILEVGPSMISALPALSLFCAAHYCYFDQVESQIIASYGGQYLGPFASARGILEKVGEGNLDMVYTSHSLEHVNPSTLAAVIGAIASATAAGGHFFAEVPDDLQAGHFFVPHVLFFSERSLVRLLERNGFEIVNVGRWKSPGSAGSDTENGERAKKEYATTPRTGSGLREMVWRIPFLAKALKPLRLMRGLRKTLRIIPTPYDSRPYLRVIARKL